MWCLAGTQDTVSRRASESVSDTERWETVLVGGGRSHSVEAYAKVLVTWERAESVTRRREGEDSGTGDTSQDAVD